VTQEAEEELERGRNMYIVLRIGLVFYHCHNISSLLQYAESLRYLLPLKNFVLFLLKHNQRRYMEVNECPSAMKMPCVIVVRSSVFQNYLEYLQDTPTRKTDVHLPNTYIGL
jgi:hypothetical protein